MGTPYLTMADLTGLIPGKFLIEALDDDGDGAADSAVLAQVIADASSLVDGIVGGPFSNPLPAKVVNAAKYFAVEVLYKRRGKEESNPYKKDADAARSDLADVANGKAVLVPSITPGRPSITAIIAPSTIKPRGTNNS